jgi:hypothetical protein
MSIAGPVPSPTCSPFVALAHVLHGGHGRRLRDANQLHGEVAFDGLTLP